MHPLRGVLPDGIGYLDRVPRLGRRKHNQRTDWDNLNFQISTCSKMSLDRDPVPADNHVGVNGDAVVAREGFEDLLGGKVGRREESISSESMRRVWSQRPWSQKATWQQAWSL